jgi:hypothetical protein
MEQPQFPLPPGRYLAASRPDSPSSCYHQWLDESTLYDGTHLPCRSAQYRPLAIKDGAVVTAGAKPLSPQSSANLRDFPDATGAAMPSIKGHSKHDYAMLFLVGKAITPPTTPI